MKITSLFTILFSLIIVGCSGTDYTYEVNDASVVEDIAISENIEYIVDGKIVEDAFPKKVGKNSLISVNADFEMGDGGINEEIGYSVILEYENELYIILVKVSDDYLESIKQETYGSNFVESSQGIYIQNFNGRTWISENQYFNVINMEQSILSEESFEEFVELFPINDEYMISLTQINESPYAQVTPFE